MKRTVFACGIIIASTVNGSTWQTTQSTSPIDDSMTVHIIQEAVGPHKNRYGRTGHANLQILCENNRTGLALVLPELYTSDINGLGSVTFRVDKQQAFVASLIASNDHDSLALVGNSAIRAIKKMLGGQKLLVQVIAVSEPSHLIEFNIQGIDEAIKPVQAACGWRG